MKRPTFVERTQGIITLENARAWQATGEKWMFVTDLILSCGIDYDPHGANIERMVRSVEWRFRKLLESSTPSTEDFIRQLGADF